MANGKPFAATLGGNRAVNLEAKDVVSIVCGFLGGRVFGVKKKSQTKGPAVMQRLVVTRVRRDGTERTSLPEHRQHRGLEWEGVAFDDAYFRPRLEASCVRVSSGSSSSA